MKLKQYEDTAVVILVIVVAAFIFLKANGIL